MPSGNLGLRENADSEEGGKSSLDFADVINGWLLLAAATAAMEKGRQTVPPSSLSSSVLRRDAVDILSRNVMLIAGIWSRRKSSYAMVQTHNSV